MFGGELSWSWLIRLPKALTQTFQELLQELYQPTPSELAIEHRTASVSVFFTKAMPLLRPMNHDLGDLCI